MASRPSSKSRGFTAQVQRCCVEGCDRPGTHHATQSPRGAAALTTPPDQWEDIFYCDEHYEEEYGDRNPNSLGSSW